jgi:hypothetical protein
LKLLPAHLKECEYLDFAVFCFFFDCTGMGLDISFFEIGYAVLVLEELE